jgi:hypothetical protein
VTSAPRVAFLSASVPDPNRWDASFDPFEITDAVVAFASAFLSAGWTLVTAAHPTIAPLILHVGGGLRTLQDVGQVRLYQSDLFQGSLPEATLTLAEQDFVTIVWTSKVEGDEPQYGRWDDSLLAMRRQMFTDNEIEAAIFVGGMEGITDEWALLAQLRPSAGRFPIWGPGGASAGLSPPTELAEELTTSRLYPFLAEVVLDYLRRRPPQLPVS